MSYYPANNISKLNLVPDLDMNGYSQEKLNEYIRQFRTTSSDFVNDVLIEYTSGTVLTSDEGYQGACYSPSQNRIYLVPYNSSNVATWHYIDCNTGNVVGYTHGFGTSIVNNAYSGACFSPTQNRIYLVPVVISNQSSWHYIDCSNGNVVDYTHGFGTSLPSSAYNGACYSPTQNCIYLVPYGIASEEKWHYIDCSNGNVVEYTHGFGINGITGNAYLGACYSPTQNRIYFSPYDQSDDGKWHYVDCDTGNIVEYTHGFGTTLPYDSYYGACYSPTQNRIYLVPFIISSSASWHYIDCDTGNVVDYEHGYGTTLPILGYTTACYSPSKNRIYLIPRNIRAQSTWHYIDCDTGNVVGYEHGYGTSLSSHSYNGACYSPTQNRIYLVPNNVDSLTEWHYIQTFADIPASKKLMANGIFNKY